MARTRMIKPEFWDDEKLAKVSRDARLLFVGLWSNSDDYGVVKGHPAWLKNRIFPYDEIPLEIFDGWLAELAAIRVIIPFLHNGERYYHIRNFSRHQTINRPSGTRNPAPPETPSDDPGVPKDPDRSQGAAQTDSLSPQGALMQGSDIEKEGMQEDSRSPHGVLSEPSVSTHGALTAQTETETETEGKEKPKGGCGGETKPAGAGIRERFARFWKAYPKKRSKGQAERVFFRIDPDEQLLATMIATIERAMTSEEWLKESGKYIPYPATWLGARGWEDEITAPPLAGAVSEVTARNLRTLRDWRSPP
ncbi:MAG TPA: hypothetical protein DCZ97_15910 [Syntrophus sp. (in: bacteria)]|nr:hypothetical protein [Syntrophus sp. (in: bacteria)]